MSEGAPLKWALGRGVASPSTPKEVSGMKICDYCGMEFETGRIYGNVTVCSPECEREVYLQDPNWDDADLVAWDAAITGEFDFDDPIEF